MSGFFDLLLSPLTALFRLIGHYPWPAIALCAAGAGLLITMRMQAYASGLVMVAAIVMIWLDERSNARAINQGAPTGE